MTCEATLQSIAIAVRDFFPVITMLAGYLLGLFLFWIGHR